MIICGANKAIPPTSPITWLGFGRTVNDQVVAIFEGMRAPCDYAIGKEYTC